MRRVCTRLLASRVTLGHTACFKLFLATVKRDQQSSSQSTFTTTASGRLQYGRRIVASQRPCRNGGGKSKTIVLCRICELPLICVSKNRISFSSSDLLLAPRDTATFRRSKEEPKSWSGTLSKRRKEGQNVQLRWSKEALSRCRGFRLPFMPAAVGVSASVVTGYYRLEHLWRKECRKCTRSYPPRSTVK